MWTFGRILRADFVTDIRDYRRRYRPPATPRLWHNAGLLIQPAAGVINNKFKKTFDSTADAG